MLIEVPVLHCSISCRNAPGTIRRLEVHCVNTVDLIRGPEPDAPGSCVSNGLQTTLTLILFAAPGKCTNSDKITMQNSLRRRVALQLDPVLRSAPGLSPANRFITAIILFSSLLAILETEPTILSGREFAFGVLETIILFILIFEYACRVWSSIENPTFASRIRYIVTPGALLDLAVILIIMLTMYGFEGVILRLLRLGRLLRLAKLGRYSTAMTNICEALNARRFELLVSFAIAMALLLISASALYVIESEYQPEAFGSIPRAMWWSIATLTTVGYGDVVPVTALGRVFAAITALTGIGLIAMPAGILASAFSDAVQKRRNEQE